MAAWITWSGAAGFTSCPTPCSQADVEESYGHFVRHFGKPAGFSSPGFYSDERVMLLLDRLGFRYNGDGIGGEPRRATAGGRELRHWTIPVTLAGPRTIPFLEYHGARGTPGAPRSCGSLTEHLEARTHVILYGHPCYEGVREAGPAPGVRRSARAWLPLRHDAEPSRSGCGRAPPSDDPGAQRLRHEAGGDQDGAGRARPPGATRGSRAWSACRPSTVRMLDQVLGVFGLHADHDLDLMTAGPVAGRA